jgi:MFS family permease
VVATTEGPARWREVFAGARGRLTAGLLVLEAVAAIEALIVVTILPAVERDLGQVELYGWVFSAYSLAAFGSIPLVGRAVDRYGPRRPLALMLGLYATGLLVAAIAPSMMVVVLGRFIQGLGAGGLYAVSVGSVGDAYPDRLRPRVLALLSSMWILPGLIGPPLGAFVAATLGWRWAFPLALPPLAIATVLVFPALGTREAVAVTDAVTPMAIRWPLQLMGGAALLLGGITVISIWSLPLIAVGLVIALMALRHIVPPGTLLARPGLPAVAAGAFMLSAAFLAVDGFLTLLLTSIRGLSDGTAASVVTLATLTWAGGSWWQSRVAATVDPGRLVTIAAVLQIVGTVMVGSVLWSQVPVTVAYAGWAVAGAGMGIGFPTFPYVAMRGAAEGRLSTEISSTLLMDMLGVGIGAGLGGSCIAIAKAAGLPLRTGLLGAIGVAIAFAATLPFIARRLPRVPTAGATGPEAPAIPAR